MCILGTRWFARRESLILKGLNSAFFIYYWPRSVRTTVSHIKNNLASWKCQFPSSYELYNILYTYHNLFFTKTHFRVYISPIQLHFHEDDQGENDLVFRSASVHTNKHHMHISKTQTLFCLLVLKSKGCDTILLWKLFDTDADTDFVINNCESCCCFLHSFPLSTQNVLFNRIVYTWNDNHIEVSGKKKPATKLPGKPLPKASTNTSICIIHRTEYTQHATAHNTTTTRQMIRK